MRHAVIAIVIVVVLPAACSRKIEYTEVVEARVEPCTTLCDRKQDCNELPSDAFATREECFQECSTLGGAFDLLHWGRAPGSETDECFDEWVAQIECLAELSCDDRRAEVSKRYDESFCGYEVLAESHCTEPYRGGAQ